MGSLGIGQLSVWHWLLAGTVVLLVFAARHMISDMMGDIARWVRALRR